MNRTLFVAVFVICCFAGSHLAAQSFTYRFDSDKDSLTTNVPLNEISTRAFRNFIKTFGDIPAATWTKRAGGITVRFYTPDSVQYLVQYSRNGHPLTTHVYYTDKNAPTRVCADIKYRYPEYAMLFVNELDNDAAPIFEVGLLDDTEFLLVQVKNDEVTPVRSFTGYIRPR